MKNKSKNLTYSTTFELDPMFRYALTEARPAGYTSYKRRHIKKADDEGRTRNIQLGKLALCQLSYVREKNIYRGIIPFFC